MEHTITDYSEILGLKERSSTEEKAIEHYLQTHEWINPFEARRGQQYPDDLRKTIIRSRIAIGLLILDTHGQLKEQKNEPYRYMAADNDAKEPLGINIRPKVQGYNIR